MNKKTKISKGFKINNLMLANAHRKYYVTNIMGGITEQDFRFELLNQKIGEGKKMYFVSDALVILSPIGAKKLFLKLRDCLQVWENERGIIDVKGDRL